VLIYKLIHLVEAHVRLLASELGEVGNCLQSLSDQGELTGGLLLRILLRQVEQVRRQDRGTYKAQEYRRAYQDIAHLVRLAVVLTLVPQLGKHLLHLHREVDTRVKDPSTHQMQDLHQLLPVRLQTRLVRHLGRVDLKLVIRVDYRAHTVAQRLLQIAVTDQFHVELHGLGRQTVAPERQARVLQLQDLGQN